MTFFVVVYHGCRSAAVQPDMHGKMHGGLPQGRE